MKLDKSIVQRRLALMEAEGVVRILTTYHIDYELILVKDLCSECSCWCQR